MNIKIIKEAPNRFPTKISGLLLIIEFIPILNSGTEVSIPKTKNDIAKGEILNLWAKFSTDLIIIPEQYQITKNEEKYNKTLNSIIN